MMVSRGFLLFTLLVGFTMGDNSMFELDNEEMEQPHHRELFSWWDFLNLVGIPDPRPPCPPDLVGPPNRPCNPKPPAAPKKNNKGSSSKYNYTNYTTYSSSSSSSSQASYETTSSTSQETGQQQNVRAASAWWLLAAAVASVVIGAAIWGRRKIRQRHLLEGSVQRRMNLFSKFADSALCGAVGGGAGAAAAATTAAAVDKNDKGVELMSPEEKDYARMV